MTDKLVQVAPIEREMTSVEATLLGEARNHSAYQAAAVVGYDVEGFVVCTPSEMSRADLIALLVDALDAVKG